MQALVAARPVELPGPDQVDLGTNERADDDQEGEQARVAWVTARARVSADERTRERLAATVDVHDEEREVVGDVDDAQRAVELDGVHDFQRLGEQDVLRA